MRGFSRVVIAGNLGGDPDLRYSANGTPVANFSVAVNRKERRDGEDRDPTDWYRVTFFGKQAEIADQYLRRGAPVLVDGRLQIDEWQDRDGKPRTTVKIVGDNFQMLGSKDDAQNETGGRPTATSERATGNSSEGWNYDDDLDEVPF